MDARLEPAQSQPVPAVAKCIAVIRYLDSRQGVGATLAEIAGDLGITKSHCLGILRTLVSENWVNHDLSRRRYRLGGALLRDLGNLLGKRDRTAQLHDELITLSSETKLPSILCRIDENDEFVAIDKVEAAGELLATVQIGHRYPWDAPAQMRARLAFSKPELVDAAIARKPRAFTVRTLTGREELLAAVEETACRGYAVGKSEYTPGIMTLAAPILDAFGHVAFILQCPGVQPVLEPREQEVAASLLRAADRIRALL